MKQLRAEQVGRRFMRKSGTANFFYGVQPQSLELPEGSLTVIMGRSGSGKTTLLNLLSGMLPPTEGKVFHGEKDLYAMSDAELSEWRGTKMGVIPQGRAMLDALTVMENILLPGNLYPKKDRSGTELAALAEELLQRLGIAHLADSFPAELSGGELRRAAIARAVLYEPDFLFADEPTGDLDDENTEIVLKLLREEADRGAVVLMVTHEREAASYADRCYRMEAGKLQEI
ncbi:MAG: ATP-binding cassette domain-containing protein [Lachnospiraceae bacterium]|nr:ATP-binding cassette domain-containing protein [Lachnospiraceae bacterium]